ncbi:MAG: sodium-dependent transporter [Phocaeicola sp.]
MNARASFGSKIGAVLAAAGSAVGLGNIWRFPYEVGNYGGAAFILIYLLFILLLGLPIMLAEFTVGRYSRLNTGAAYNALAPNSSWRLLGYSTVWVGFLILSYYSVVAGWTLKYTLKAGLNGFTNQTPDDFVAAFSSFSQNPYQPLIFLAVFLILTHLIIVRGVKEGIERYSKIMMPILFILILVLAGCSLTLPNAIKGVEFLLHPDFSKVNGAVLLGAMGQAFFSLSLGMGCLTTYASYFRKDTNLARTALSVASVDTFVAIMSSLIIFPAAFSVGINPDAGPSLIFITLPNVFQQAFSGLPILSYIFSVSFYFLLAVAALTSTISMHEVVTAFLHERFKITRYRAAFYVTVSSILLGILCSLSLGVLNHLTLFNLTIFDLFDFLTAKIMLPLGGMFTSIFVGWRLERSVSYLELSNNNKLKIHFFGAYILILKYVAPLAIGTIFLSELGLINL